MFKIRLNTLKLSITTLTREFSSLHTTAYLQLFQLTHFQLEAFKIKTFKF